MTENILYKGFGVESLSRAVKEAEHTGKSLAESNKSTREKSRNAVYTSLSPQTCYDILSGKLDPRWNQLQEICRIIDYPMKRLIDPTVPRAEIVLYWDVKQSCYQPRNYDQPPEALFFPHQSDINTHIRAVMATEDSNPLLQIKNINPISYESFLLFDTSTGDFNKEEQTRYYVMHRRVLMQCANDFKTYYGRVLDIINEKKRICKFQWIKCYKMHKGAIIEDYEIIESNYRKVYNIHVENLVPVGDEVKREFL